MSAIQSSSTSLSTSTRCRKTVTPKKIEANQRNSERSTGPRTERGKRNSRFNAVTLGLFAKHVVIPVCDGYNPERDFNALLDSLHQDFVPVGSYEEWLVVKIAECMWRLRRATRCESGSVRETSARAASRWNHCDDDQLIEGFAREIYVLDEAERQLRDSGTLSQETYGKVLPLVEKEKQSRTQCHNDHSVTTNIDCELFLSCVTARRESLDPIYKSLIRIEGKHRTHALTTTLSQTNRIWTGSSATKKECTARSTGRYRDFCSPRSDERPCSSRPILRFPLSTKVQNKANK